MKKHQYNAQKQRIKVKRLTRMQVPVWYSDQHGDLAGRCMHGGSMEIDGSGGRSGHRCA